MAKITLSLEGLGEVADFGGLQGLILHHTVGVHSCVVCF
jgi:hypothetical protein